MKFLFLEYCVARVELLFQLSFFRRACSAYENKLMNVYLMEAQFFQMVELTRSSPNGSGASSSGSDLPPPPPPPPPRTGVSCQIL
jgi:hypothetical protein